jgi:hypothetical protein
MPGVISFTVAILYTNIPSTKLLKGVDAVVKKRESLGNNSPLSFDSISTTELGFIEGWIADLF